MPTLPRDRLDMDRFIAMSTRGRSSHPRITAQPGRPVTLLDNQSPYGSRRLVVEYDGWTSAAYMYDATDPIAATWLANHRKAPADIDLSLLDAGQAPEMPQGYTKHPDGRDPLDTEALRAVWFEEGDGAALFEGYELLAVIPGWSDMAKGMPGYSRDVIGQTPFGWSLDDAISGLGQRVAEATDFWRWRLDPAAWDQFRQGMLGHLLDRLGPGARYWDVSGGRQPLVGVSERPPTGRRPFTVLTTVGMSCQRMPVVEQSGPGAKSKTKIELAVATTMPANQVGTIFRWLAQYPWHEVNWLGAGQTLPWYQGPTSFPLGGGHEAVLFLDNPSKLLGPDVPDLSGFTVASEPVKWLWLIPITNRERLIAESRGPASLINQMASQSRSWVVS
jgi:Suppressor of fused protein (SUFU)